MFDDKETVDTIPIGAWPVKGKWDWLRKLRSGVGNQPKENESEQQEIAIATSLLRQTQEALKGQQVESVGRRVDVNYGDEKQPTYERRVGIHIAEDEEITLVSILPNFNIIRNSKVSRLTGEKIETRKLWSEHRPSVHILKHTYKDDTGKIHTVSFEFTEELKEQGPAKVTMKAFEDISIPNVWGDAVNVVKGDDQKPIEKKDIPDSLQAVLAKIPSPTLRARQNSPTINVSGVIPVK